MIFVIDQRLKAQKVSAEKSERVLTDVVTVMLHHKLLDELFIPQPAVTHTVLKQLLKDIAATSIMKLDDYSMNKLWDLMTMIFKWQLSVTTNQNIFDISRRHLRCVAMLMPQFFPKDIIDLAMRRFDILSQSFTDDNYNCLNNTLVLWFSRYHTKISVLMRLGLQNRDGTFCLPSTISTNVLNNMGENIYKYDLKKNPIEAFIESQCADTYEINCILASIEKSQSKNRVELKLPIELGDKSKKRILNIVRDTQYEQIDTCLKIKNTDLTFVPDIPKSPQEDLLELLGETSDFI